jgi:group I intron endonuclease
MHEQLPEKAACVYSVTNKVNGKMYIGVTVDYERRQRSHLKHNIRTRSLLKKAVAKYGEENFVFEVLCIGTRDYCYLVEPRFISAYNTRTPDGYNICSGGRGSKGLLAEYNGMYGRTGELHPHFGKPGYRKGIPHTEETKQKMREAHLGKVFSEETRKKISENAKKRLEHMAKMREAARVARENRKLLASKPLLKDEE